MQAQTSERILIQKIVVISLSVVALFIGAMWRHDLMHSASAFWVVLSISTVFLCLSVKGKNTAIRKNSLLIFSIILLFSVFAMIQNPA